MDEDVDVDPVPVAEKEKTSEAKKSPAIPEAVNGWFIVIAAAVILGFVLTNIRLN